MNAIWDFFLKRVNNLELCYTRVTVWLLPPLRKFITFNSKDTCQQGKSIHTSEERAPAYSKPLSYFFTYILCIFIPGRLEIFRYRFFYTWIFSCSQNKRERQTIVQNSISNFQPKHQNRKLASRHFAAKLDPKQKVSFAQRKMFCFCLKKGCNWHSFSPQRLPQSSVLNFLFQMPTALLKLNTSIHYCKCTSNSTWWVDPL